MYPGTPVSSVPVLSREQMIEVDRVMVEDLGIGLVQMMENAGRNLARLVFETYLRTGSADQVVVLAGSGGNGGGGLAAARRLKGWDISVSVWTSKPHEEYRGVIAEQLRAVKNLGVPVDAQNLPSQPSGNAVIIDALIGYSLVGPPKGRVANLVHWIRSVDHPVVSLDVPSGIDSTSGHVLDTGVVADVTMTLALPKTGLVASRSRQHVGRIFVADIGVPATLYRDAFGFDVGGLFDAGGIVELIPDTPVQH